MTTNNVNPHAAPDGPRWNYANSMMLYLPPKLASCIQQIGVELVKAGVPKVVLSDLAASLLSAGNDLDTPYTEEDFQNAMKEFEMLNASAKCDADLEQCIAKLQAAVAELEDGPPVPHTRKVFIDLIGHEINSRRIVVEVPADCSDGDIARLSGVTLDDLCIGFSEGWDTEDSGIIVHDEIRVVGDAPNDSEPDVSLLGDLPTRRQGE